MKHPIPILFMGSDKVAQPLLEYLIHNQGHYRLAGVFTQPDRPQGRGQQLHISPIKQLALQCGVPCYQPEKLDHSHVAWLQAHGIQAAFVMAYGQLLRQSFLDALPLHVWNLHTSLLPKYRGAAPIETAIAEGETQSGISLMQLTLKMDEGPVLAMESTPITPTTTGPELRHTLAHIAAKLTATHLDSILDGTAKPQPQTGTPTYTRKLRKEDGWLDCSLTAHTLSCRVRAFQNWPGTFFTYARPNEEPVLIKASSASVVPMSIQQPPGTILEASAHGLHIATASQCLVLHSLQRPGGKCLPASDFLRGFPMPAGTCISWEPAQPLVR